MPFTRLSIVSLALMTGFSARASQKSCGNELESIALRNGATVQGRMVSVISFGLENLAKNTPSVYRELVDHARKPERAIGDDAREKLDAMGLLNPDGTLDADVRDVTLSSARGRGAKVAFMSPIAPAELTDEELKIYFERTEDFAHDVVALGEELNVAVDVALGEAGITETERIAPNGALALLVDPTGIPVYFLTPQGGRHAFIFDFGVDAAARTAFAEALVARFGLKPLARRSDLLAVTKDVHAMPLPDPVLLTK